MVGELRRRLTFAKQLRHRHAEAPSPLPAAACGTDHAIWRLGQGAGGIAAEEDIDTALRGAAPGREGAIAAQRPRRSIVEAATRRR